MKRFGVLLIFALSTALLFAQSIRDSAKTTLIEKLQSPPPFGNGTITITQDSLVNVLVKKHIALNETDNNLIGWRIQIYNSSGKEAKDEANDERGKFITKFPNTKAYIVYQPPFFKIRVGDFRSKQDAYALYKELLSMYPVSYLVKDKINLPNL